VHTTGCRLASRSVTVSPRRARLALQKASRPSLAVHHPQGRSMRLIPPLCLAAAAILAGCATQPSGPPGKHLVYKDAGGKIVRVFDYPSNDFCARVEKAAAGAKCQPDAINAGMAAQATLRYNPPGMLVHAHYVDMARCQTETRQLGPGVELINACTTKQ
jgi:hypothetical protein